mgnify:CR=1 FL=1
MSQTPEQIHIRIDEEARPHQDFLDDRAHTLKAWFVDNGSGGQVYLDFSSRLAVVEFAKSLLGAAYFDQSGLKEWDPQDGWVKDRVRLTDDSAKLLLFYDWNSPIPPTD